MSNHENVSWQAILKKIATLDSNQLSKLDAFLNQLKFWVKSDGLIFLR